MEANDGVTVVTFLIYFISVSLSNSMLPEQCSNAAWMEMDGKV